jgi:hypothetical protein
MAILRERVVWRKRVLLVAALFVLAYVLQELGRL